MNNLYRFDGWCKSTLGQALAGSQIYVCSPQPANIATLPPSPLASIFSDPAGLAPISQPISADNFGHYDFYALSGIYTIIVVYGGKVQQVYPDQTVGIPGAATIGSLASFALLAGATFTGPITSPSVNSTVYASQFSGASIVEKIQAAITSLSGGPGVVVIPAETFVASPVSSWQLGYNGGYGSAGQTVGVIIPSNVTIMGAGAGLTIINVTRIVSDPPAFLFVNKNYSTGDSNIRLSGMTINWADSSTVSYSACISLFDYVDKLEIDHVEFIGEANNLCNNLDCTHFDIHDNRFAISTKNSGNNGNACLGIARFGGTQASPVTPYINAGGHIYNNYFIQTDNSVNTQFSMLVVSQSCVVIEGNTFDGYTQTKGNVRVGNSIEMGTDNLGLLPSYITIKGNKFLGTAGMNPLNIFNSDITENDCFMSSILVQSAGTGYGLSDTGVHVEGNHIRWGSITIGNDDAGTGRSTVIGNVVEDSGDNPDGTSYSSDFGIAVYNSVTNAQGSVIKNNVVKYGAAGIIAAGASVIDGNIIINSNSQQNGTLALQINPPGNGDTFKTAIVNNNTIINDQNAYTTGTIGMVATPTGTSYISSGVSVWVYLTGGTWSNWTNRWLWVGSTRYAIKTFLDANHVELELPVYIASGTAYSLQNNSGTTSMYTIMSLANGIGSFTNNSFISTAADPLPADHAIITEHGKSVDYINGNRFSYWSLQSPSTTYDYEATTALGGLTVQGATPTGSLTGIALGITTAATASDTGAIVLPAHPAGFLEINISGTIYKLPYYAS